MRKFILTMALILGIGVSVNAQRIATENSNAFDNIGIGLTGGVSTPLDFNSVFPVNPNVGLKITKDFTPAFGIQIEGLAFLNDNHFTDLKTTVKATNVSLLGAINLSNALFGYRGTPRTFEVSPVAGIGWLHEWNTSVNSLSSKTGIDFAFNLGKAKAHSIVLTPAIYWNLNSLKKIQFNKNHAQLALNLTYIYHFKTSNGTHHFKTYDISAMESEINYLRGRVDELENKPIPVATNAVAAVEAKTVEKVVLAESQWYIQFAKSSSALTDEAKEVLDKVSAEAVDIVGTASPEGSAEFNQALSEKRAAVVADYLTKRGIKVNSWIGKGSTGDSSNRLAIISVVK